MYYTYVEDADDEANKVSQRKRIGINRFCAILKVRQRRASKSSQIYFILQTIPMVSFVQSILFDSTALEFPHIHYTAISNND